MQRTATLLVVVSMAAAVMAGAEFMRGLEGAAQPTLVPAPVSAKMGTTQVPLAAGFKFVTAGGASNFMDQAYARYEALIFSHGAPAATSGLALVTVTLKSSDHTLQLDTDESYQLELAADNTATIYANTVFGALHALETFSQLVTFNFDSETYVINTAPFSISDAPRFPHRGVLIDTSRHWLSVAAIKRVIDSLSYAKLNVLHWHLVDSQAFAYPSKAFPKLAPAGAYSATERYTVGEIKDVIEYARLRGVRVMAEIDIPGHAASMGKGYPDLWPSPTCQEPLDPSKQFTWTFLDGLLSEVADLFPEGLFHLGGDEVDTDCWTKTPAVADWMKAKNMTTEETYMQFVETGHQIVSKKNRDPVNWEEVFNHFGDKLDKQTIVHIWLDHATLAKVVAAGYRALLSNSDVWYLDHLDVPMEKFYLNEPFAGITDPAQQKLVLGGEVCQWGETVDGSDIEQTIWPRAAAAAERLWSPQTVNDTAEFTPRYNWFRCLLNARGIAAAPATNANARTGPSGPGGCYAQ